MPKSTDMAALSVNALLDQVADRVPSPGGGAVAATVGALSAALGRMVVAYSINKKTVAAVRTQAEALAGRLHRADALLRALVTQDAKAYESMSATAKAVKTGAATQEEHAQAVLAAVAVPMEMAAILSNLLADLEQFKERSSRYLLSDLGVTAILAEAAARAAAYMVRVNVSDVAGADHRERIASEIKQITAHCEQSREAIEVFVGTQLEGAGDAGR